MHEDLNESLDIKPDLQILIKNQLEKMLNFKQVSFEIAFFKYLKFEEEELEW